jgi:hypothetical protein
VVGLRLGLDMLMVVLIDFSWKWSWRVSDRCGEVKL